MGLLGRLIKTTIHTVTAPIEIAKDVVTLGGLCTGQDQSYTEKRLKQIAKDGTEVVKELEDL